MILNISKTDGDIDKRKRRY